MVERAARPTKNTLPYPGKLVQSSLRFGGWARRTRWIARPLGVGRGEPTPARAARLGAPRIHHRKGRKRKKARRGGEGGGGGGGAAGRPPPARLGSAPREFTIEKDVNGRMLVGWERAA